MFIMFVFGWWTGVLTLALLQRESQQPPRVLREADEILERSHTWTR